jgi:hypothetical protein
MISKSELYRKIKRDIGDQLFRLISESFIEETLHDESLRVFSDYYPKLVSITIHKDDAIPYQDYTGRTFNYMRYRLPNITQPTSYYGMESEQYEWRDIENYYITGNDTSDIYSGGNFLLNQYFLSARAAMPHTRSYYQIQFEEPDILIIDPPQQQHRNFTVVMQANRTLKTIPRNMQTLFLQLVVCDIEIALLHKFKHETGNQTYGGIEIDTKLDDFSDAKSDREKLIDIFEHDWMKNPERFEVETLYQSKS